MRGHYFGGADHNRYRLRRALSLRHRPSSHHPRHQLEGRQSNLGSLSSRNDSGRNNNGFGSALLDHFDSTILVEDVSTVCGIRNTVLPTASCQSCVETKMIFLMVKR